MLVYDSFGDEPGVSVDHHLAVVERHRGAAHPRDATACSGGSSGDGGGRVASPRNVEAIDAAHRAPASVFGEHTAELLEDGSPGEGRLFSAKLTTD